MTFLTQREVPLVWLGSLVLLACSLERMDQYAMCNALLRVFTTMLLSGSECLVLGWGVRGVIRVLYSHDSDAGILHYSVMQAGRSLVMRYSTRGVNISLSSAVVRLNVSFFRDLFYTLVLLSLSRFHTCV
jgi:hypothetical protein